VRLPVREIRCRQVRFALNDVASALQPERLEIVEMPQLLGETPASLDLARAIDTGEQRPESMRRALQPLEDSR